MPELSELARGCRLHVAVSLLRSGGLPVTKRDVKTQWGGILSDEAIAEAARWLCGAGLAVSVPNGRWPALQLTSGGRQLVLPGEVTPLPAELSQISSSLTPPPAESGLEVDSAPSGVISPEKALTPPPAESSGRKGPDSAPSGVKLVEDSDSLNTESISAKLLAALRACGVYPNAARKPANAVAARPAYLADCVAHIAFARSGECEQKPGPYLVDALAHWDVGPTAYMPPEGLTLDQALQWAELGETTAQYWARCAAVVEVVDDDAGKISPVASDQARPVLPEWSAALARLRGELARAAFDNYLARVSVGRDGDGAWVVSCPTAAVRDFVSARLSGAIGRALGVVTGESVALKFELGQDITTGGGAVAPGLA